MLSWLKWVWQIWFVAPQTYSLNEVFGLAQQLEPDQEEEFLMERSPGRILVQFASTQLAQDNPGKTFQVRSNGRKLLVRRTK